MAVGRLRVYFQHQDRTILEKRGRGLRYYSVSNNPPRITGKMVSVIHRNTKSRVSRTTHIQSRYANILFILISIRPPPYIIHTHTDAHLSTLSQQQMKVLHLVSMETTIPKKKRRPMILHSFHQYVSTRLETNFNI